MTTEQSLPTSQDLFYDRLIASYVDGSPRFVERDWLWKRVQTALEKPDSRFVLLTAEPGAGKSSFLAWVARKQPNWPRYFIRRDQRTPLEDGGARGFLEKVGFQLAARFPEAFQTDAVRISISQAVEISGGQITGAEIDRLIASPFYAKAVQISQQVKGNQGSVTGIRVRELVTDPNRISLLDLQRMALLAPTRALQASGKAEPLVVMIDALDELRYQPAGDNVLDWLTRCPELPANVRILVTSRPDREWLAAFRGAQQDRLVEEEIPQFGDNVRKDTTEYARALSEVPEVEASLVAHRRREQSPQEAADQFVADAVDKAQGNLGYLAALGRAVDQAIDSNDRALLEGLLELKQLPATLQDLYGYFLKLLRRSVGDLSVVVEDPVSRRQGLLGAWTNVYRPVLGVLAVAMEPVTPAQMRLLGRMLARESDVTEAVGRLRQFLDEQGGRYSFYHATLPEFLVDEATRRNPEYLELAVDPASWHDTIVAAGTEFVQGEMRWMDCEEDCDPYLMRYLVGHIRAQLTLAKNVSDRRRVAQTLYVVILDKSFRAAQQRILGDLATTLADLRTALRTALDRDDLIKALECAGVYWDIKHSLTVTSAIFDDVQKGNFELALQRSRHYEVLPGWRENWQRSLQLYLAWEAAERGDDRAVRQIMDSAQALPPTQMESITQLWDALLVRIARALAQASVNGRNAEAWLATLAPGRDTGALLAAYDLAELDPADRATRAGELDQKLMELKKLVDEGDPEAIAALPSLEEMGQGVAELRDLWVALAATPEGQAGIHQALRWLLPNPYPRYRDIGLVALGTACLAAPDVRWARDRLQDILETALNREGVTFTFCLPWVLLEEARTRELSVQGLDAYLNEAIMARNRWGTAMRAQSARAAGLFWQGKSAEAIAALEEAGRADTGLAGYGTLTLLSLANRCYEFGIPDRVTEPIWGTGRNTPLLKGAEVLAGRVRDPQFRAEREELVGTFGKWSRADTPDAAAVLDILRGTANPDTRELYVDHVTARWASPGYGDRDAIKEVVLSALPRATSLDTVLARLFGLSLGRMDDAELQEAVRLCAAYLLFALPKEG